jgi:YVTN family beta-propeller protein
MIIGSEASHAAGSDPLTVEKKIPLGEVAGRIDHLAFDSRRHRIYVAELGNNSVGIVDLKANRVARTVPGFDEPQGIAYEPTTDTVYVANGGDGSVRLFNGEDFAPLGTIALAKDADNVRIDPSTHRVYVGYGSGALAVIDPASRRRMADIPLRGHPESFQLHPNDDRIFVNVPDADQIALVSRTTNRQIATWKTGDLRSNYPLTLDVEKSRVMSVFRRPAHLQAFDMASGHVPNGSEVCGDSDDVFFDAQRQRVYVICGEGFVDSLDAAGVTLTRIGRVKTSSGSRTGLFVQELDRLLVAIRAHGGEPAAVWILRPAP